MLGAVLTTELRPHPLEARPERLPGNAAYRAAVIEAHRAACEAEEYGYLDPRTGLFVMTAVALIERGTCCGEGCRHCPFVAT